MVIIFSMVCNFLLLVWCWRLDDKIAKLEDMLEVLSHRPLVIHRCDDGSLDELKFKPYKKGEVQE